MAKIYRDDYGIPHIMATTSFDAAKAIAYVHSEDDFYTLQLWFLAIKFKSGHFDDWDGPYLDFLSFFFDIQSKTLDLLPTISDEYKSLADSYCSGINLYAKEHEENVLDPSIFPVNSVDLLQVQHLMEVIGIQIDKPYSYLNKKQSRRLPHKEGSNAIAIGVNKSASKSSLIAVSPHQMLEGIFSYYEVHLSIEDCENSEYHGFILPCSFSIFMGTNFQIAWGSTASYPEMYTIYKIDVQKRFGRIKSFLYDGKEVLLKRCTYKNHIKLYGKIPIPIIKNFYKSLFIKNVYVNSESSNLNENAFYNSVVDNFILPVNYINPQFIKIPWEQQSVFVGFICFLYEDNGIHYGLIRSEKRTFVRFKYKPQEEKFEIGNVVTYEYKKRYSKHFNGNNIVYTLDNANQGFNVLNLNYKPENKDKDSSEILLEYIKNDYWYKQGHKSKNYILSNEIISEYFKKKDYIGLQRKISAYVQQYDIKKACEQYFVTIEEDFRYRVGRDDYYSCCEVGKIEKYSTDTYIQKILPKYGKCLYEDKGYMAADKMAIDTTGYKEEASIKQIQIRNNALKYYNPICHEHELYEEILSDYISEQKENEYLLEKLFHYNTLVNYGKSYFSHDDLEKVRMDFMSFASHIL